MASPAAQWGSVLAWLRAHAGGWFTGVFVLSFAFAQFAYSIVMLDPNDQKWFWIALLVSLAFAAIGWRLLRQREFRLDSLDALIVAFFLYSALSLAWTPDRAAGALFLVKFAAAAAIFIYLKDFGDEPLFRRLAGCTTLAAAIAVWLGYTQPGAWGGFHNQNFITEYLLLALPFCLGYAAIAASRLRRAGAALTVLAVAWYLVVDNPSRIEFVVLPLLAAIAIGAICARRWGWRPLLAIAALLGLGFALAAAAFWEAFPYGGRGLRDSILPRIALMLDTLAMWLDAPLLGHGAGSFQFLFPGYQEDHLRNYGLDVVLLKDKQVVAGAAHNEYLQLLATLGLAGGAIAAVFIWRCVQVAQRGPAFGPVQYAALGSVVVWSVNATLEFPLQNPATLLLALAGAAMLVATRQRTQADTLRLAAGPRTAAAAAAAAFACALGVQLCDRLIDASRNFRLASYLMSAGDARNAYQAMREAHARNPWDYQIRIGVFLNAVIWMDAQSWSAPTWGERLRRQPLLSGEIDMLYATATNAGRQAGMLHSRLYYLVRSGNYPQFRDEIAESLAFLRRNAAYINDTWKMDALYGLLYDDARQIAAARHAAEKFGMPPAQVAQIRELEALARDRSARHSLEQQVRRVEPRLPPAPTGIVRRLDPPN